MESKAWNKQKVHDSVCVEMKRLQPIAVECATLALEGVHNIHGGDGLALAVLGVGDSITDDVLKELLQDTAGLLVDQTRDTLDTTTTCQAANSRARDALDVVTKNFAVTHSTALAETLAANATSSHFFLKCVVFEDENKQRSYQSKQK